MQPYHQLNRDHLLDSRQHYVNLSPPSLVLSLIYVSLPSLPLSLSPQTEAALEDSPHHHPDGLGLEEGDLGTADSQEWCRRSLSGGGDTSDEYFDSRSWHSDTLSDLSPDGEHCVGALLGVEDTYAGWHLEGSGYRAAGESSRARRREPVTAKDSHRDTTETCMRRPSCNSSARWKSPESHADKYSIDIQHCGAGEHNSAVVHACSGTEKLKTESHRDQSSLQTVCTQTQVKHNICSHIQQHNTDTTDTEVNATQGTQENKVQLQTHPDKSSHSTLTHSPDTDTCTIQIESTEEDFWETQQDCTGLHTTDRADHENTETNRQEICPSQHTEIESLELCNPYSIEKDAGSHICSSDHTGEQNQEQESLECQSKVNEHNREEHAIEVNSIGQRQLCASLGTCCLKTHNEIEINCIDNIDASDKHFTDTLNTQTSESYCTPQQDYHTLDTIHKESKLLTESDVTNIEFTEAHSTKTDTAPTNTDTEVKDTLSAQTDVSPHSLNICYSLHSCEEIPNGPLSETHPAVHVGATKAQDEVCVSSVCFPAEHAGRVGIAAEANAPSVIVNGISSAITFSAEASHPFLLSTCAPSLSALSSSSESQGASPAVRLAWSDGVELTQRDQKQLQTQNSSSRPLQDTVQSHGLIPEYWNWEGVSRATTPRDRRLPSAESADEARGGPAEAGEPASAQSQSDTDRGSEECTPPLPRVEEQRVSSDSPGSGESSQLLSGGEGRRAGSPRSLSWENKQEEGEKEEEEEEEKEGSYVYVEQGQAVEVESTVRPSPTQSNTGTEEASGHSELESREEVEAAIPVQFPSDAEGHCTQYALFGEIGGRSTECNATTEIVQDICTEGPGLDGEAALTNKIESISTIPCLFIEPVQSQFNQPELEVPQAHSFSTLSDSNNNNTKASVEGGAERGGTSGWSSQVAESSSESSYERTISSQVEPSKNVTCSELSEDLDLKSQEDSEVLLSPLDYEPYWSSEDSAVSGLGEDLEGHCHFSLAEVEELERLERGESIKNDTISHHTDRGCRDVTDKVDVKSSNSNAHNNEGIEPLVSYLERRGLLLDSDYKEEGQYNNQPLYHTSDRKRSSSSESFQEYILAEEYREHTAPQQGVRIVRYPYTDVSLNLLSISSLEPILEAERSLENSGIVEDDSRIDVKKELLNMRPTEEDRDIVDLSGDMSSSSAKSPYCQPEHERDDSTTALVLEHQQDVLTPNVEDLRIPALLQESNDRRCNDTVSYDTVSYDTTSTNSEETEELTLGGNANLHKTMKKSKVKGSQMANKSSKFSVFAKMPSFRKGRSVKGSKGEESPRESSDGGCDSPFIRSLITEQGCQGDNSDDEVFLKGNILNQTVQQAFSSVGHYEMEEEDYGFFPSTPRTRHVRQLFGQGAGDGGDDGNGALSPENPNLKQVQSGPYGQAYKRSKSNDSLNIRMRFAKAHKSLSSLFESRPIMDKENQEQAAVGTEGDSGKAKHWRKLKRAKEAELLRRTLSVSDGESSRIGPGGQNYRDLTFPSIQDRLSIPGSPSSLRSLCHTDPLSKRGVPHDGGKDTPQGCKSEGQRRKGSANGFSITFSSSGLPSSSDDSEVLPPQDTSPPSPLSPASSAALTNQLSPPWSRSPPVANDWPADSPVRPMSPKPNSPRPSAQRRVFRYPHSVRASALSLIFLGQSASVEGLTDPPERPKTLKPRASPLGSSLTPLDAAGVGGLDTQSHSSLHTSGSINELEVRKNALIAPRMLIY